MTLQSMERATVIQSRIKELRNMQTWLMDKQSLNISVIATGYGINDIIPISDGMRDLLVARCDEEITGFMEEFEKL